jgi:hypothetical protein
MIPIWDTTPISETVSGGNTNRETSGASRPSSDGPSRMPATVSPITGGCPNRRSTRLVTRATAITAASASRTWNSVSGDARRLAGPGAGRPAGGTGSCSPHARIARNTATAPPVTSV